MPAAQSFIQILGTFLAPFFIFIASLYLLCEISPFNYKTVKTIGST